MGDKFNKTGAWEDAWQQAFEGAEHTPPQKVWQGLENSLMEQQLRRYRRKLVVYQWLAAASVMLLGLWAGWWLMFAQPNTTLLTDQQLSTQPEIPQTTPSSGKGPETTGAGIPATADREERNPQYISRLEDPNDRAGRATQNANPGTDNSTVPTLQEPSAVSGLVAGASTNAAAGNKGSGKQRKAFADEVALPENGGEIQPVLGAEAGAGDLATFPDYLLSQLVGQQAELLLKNGDKEREIRVVAITRKVNKKKSRIPNGDFWLGASLAGSFFDPNMNTQGGQSLAWMDRPAR